MTEKCATCGRELSPFEEDPDDLLDCGGYGGCVNCNPWLKAEQEKADNDNEAEGDG